MGRHREFLGQDASNHHRELRWIVARHGIERPLAVRAHHRVEQLPQLVHGEVGRIDNLVGHRANGGQHLPFVLDDVGNRSARGERVRPAGFAEPAQ